MPSKFDEEAKRLCDLAYSGNLNHLAYELRFTSVNSWHRRMTPLMMAAKAPRDAGFACAELLLKFGADPRLEGVSGKTAMHFAVLGNNRRVALLLSAHDRTLVNLQTQGGDTPLMWAAGLNHKRAVKDLLRLGADVSLRNEGGQTAADRARIFESWSSYFAIVGASGKVLRNEEIDRLLSREKESHELCDLCHKCSTRRLQEVATPFNCNCRWLSRTPLMWTAATNKPGSVDCATQLLKAGADATAADFLGRTAAHLAAKAANLPLLQLLPPSCLNRPDSFGWTPLMLATYHGMRASVRQLLALGVDANVTDKARETALDIAVDCGHDAIVAELEFI